MMRAGEMAQLVKGLKYKSEDLSSDPLNPYNEPGMAVFLWLQSWGDRDKRIYGILWVVTLAELMSSRFCQRSYLKNEGGK